MFVDKFIVSDVQPSSPHIGWMKPVDDGFALYICISGQWKPLKVMDGKGTITPDDDTPWSGGGEIGPNTVGTSEIIDKSIREADLNKEVTDKLDDIYVQDVESLYINGTKPS